MTNIKFIIKPKVKVNELIEFYLHNDICEKGYQRKTIGKYLKNSYLVIGAFAQNKLIGIARVISDGIHAEIIEFCIALKYQGGKSKYKNGSLIENDKYGVGKAIANCILRELSKKGIYFVSAIAFNKFEGKFYASIGFKINLDHLNFVIDKRPYVKNTHA